MNLRFEIINPRKTPEDGAPSRPKPMVFCLCRLPFTINSEVLNRLANIQREFVTKQPDDREEPRPFPSIRIYPVSNDASWLTR